MTVDDKLLKEIFTLSKKVGSVPFRSIVKASSGFSVIAIDHKDPADKKLIETLQSVLKSHLSTVKKTHGRMAGSRPNEIGSRIEAGLVHEMKSSGLKVRQLGHTGYRDIEIIDESDRLIYLEAKTTSSVEPSGMRYFYYSSGRKIKGDARHLLLSIEIVREPGVSSIWQLKKYSLSDLTNLVVNLKAEFNASQRTLLDKSMQLLSVS
jgi:hypothetical protein